MILTYRAYVNKASGKIYFVLSQGIIDPKKKITMIIFADPNLAKTIMLPQSDFEKEFELIKLEPIKIK